MIKGGVSVSFTATKMNTVFNLDQSNNNNMINMPFSDSHTHTGYNR